ncbi:GNAT family N-acetyltransferase [Candidatus Acetothermia bacterium]|nr:GNAT family N-acetyltransferase [Candidatus Acetothermia bacterium]
MIEVKKLPEDRWKEHRDLRLEALQSDPIAYSSSYEYTEQLSEDVWKRRLSNVLFALSDDKPVGMIVYYFESETKIQHIANIFGVFVKKEYRGQGVGKKLMQSALSEIVKNSAIAKVKLTVTSVQTAAVKLYEKFGFKTVGKLEKELFVDGRYYDELVMEKHL